MRGSIVERKSGFTIVYDVGLKWDDKKEKWVRNQKWEKVPPRLKNGKWVRANKSDAQSLLAERLAQVNRGEFVEPSVLRFSEFIETWKREYAASEVDPSTINRYESHFRAHILPKLGHLELRKIGADDIQRFKAQMNEEGLSPGYIKHHLALVRQMLQHAVDWGKLRDNPAKKVKLPTVPKSEAEFWEPHEARLFFKALEEQYIEKPVEYARWNAFFLMGITGCLRIGEVLAGRWGNLDWNTGRYFVKETWKRPRGEEGASIGAPKTQGSAAPVNLSPLALEALRKHEARQKEEKLRTGEEYKEQDLIFATSKGGLLDYWNFTKRVFKPLVRQAGLRKIGTHGALRHTGAAIIIANNESPKYLQNQLRHASIQMTFDVYGHLFKDVHQEAPARMDQMLFPASCNGGPVEPC